MSHSHLAQTLLVPGIARPTLRQQLAGDALTGLLAWWDAERDAYTDTGLTTRATDGAAVAGWSDQSANAYHVTQSTAGDRPLWRASVAAFGGKPGVQFVSSDFLIRTGLSSGIAGSLSEYNIFVVFATSSATNSYMYGEGNGANNTPFVGMRHNVAVYQPVHVDDAAVTTSPAAGANANNASVHLMTFRRTAAISAVRADGVALASNAIIPGTTTLDRIAIGALPRITNGFYFTGHIAQVLLYNTDNYATIEPILKAYYGIA